MPGNDGSRLGQASRRGYIVVAPFWGQEHQTSYEYSAREHAAVLGSLREANRHFSIDSDRVFLSGHSMGGDAAWDVALSHPDLWAGLVGIVPTSARYVNHYWKNAHRLPMYLVGGELDSDRLVRNAMDLDRYFQKGFDATYVEYLGRGHEHFSDDIHRIFDWMGRKTRSFFSKFSRSCFDATMGQFFLVDRNVAGTRSHNRTSSPVASVFRRTGTGDQCQNHPGELDIGSMRSGKSDGLAFARYD